MWRVVWWYTMWMGVRWWAMWGVVRGRRMPKCKWIEAMEPVIVSGSWCGNAQHLMFFVHPLGLAGHAEVIVWAHDTLEADPKNIIVTAVTDYTRMSCTSLVWVGSFPCCFRKDKNNFLDEQLTKIYDQWLRNNYEV